MKQMSKRELLDVIYKRKRFNKIHLETECSKDYDYWSGYIKGLSEAEMLIKKLDKIDKVVIPKHIHEVIESEKSFGATMPSIIYGLYEAGEDNSNIKTLRQWIWGEFDCPVYKKSDSNINKFVKAWIEGYEVE